MHLVLTKTIYEQGLTRSDPAPIIPITLRKLIIAEY